MSEYFDYEEPPEPEYVVICSNTSEWKKQARMVAACAKSILLIGPCDLEFVHDLAGKYALQSRVDEVRGTALLWDAAEFREKSSPAAETFFRQER